MTDAHKDKIKLATATFPDKDQLQKPSNAEMGWASDAMAEMLRRLDLRYIALTPGASYRGLHDSMVNYLGNPDIFIFRASTLTCANSSSDKMPSSSISNSWFSMA